MPPAKLVRRRRRILKLNRSRSALLARSNGATAGGKSEAAEGEDERRLLIREAIRRGRGS
jgi:hypothetical protein